MSSDDISISELEAFVCYRHLSKRLSLIYYSRGLGVETSVHGFWVGVAPNPMHFPKTRTVLHNLNINFFAHRRNIRVLTVTKFRTVMQKIHIDQIFGMR